MSIVFSFILLSQVFRLKSSWIVMLCAIWYHFKKLHGPFLWLGFNCLKARVTSRRQFIFTTKCPGIPGTHFSDLGRIKDWVALGATQWFWTRDPWIGNPVPKPLGHCLASVWLQPAYFVKVWLLHGCLSRFLNFANSNKSRKGSRLGSGTNNGYSVLVVMVYKHEHTHTGVFLGQNSVWLSDAALNDFFCFKNLLKRKRAL